MSEKPKRFAAKYAPGARPDPAIQAEISKRCADAKVPCAVAFEIAKDLKVLPGAVGQTVDLMDYRLTKCQLGLFGYGNRKKIVTPLEQVPPELENALLQDGTEGRMACKTAWEIAARLQVNKLVVSSACETLHLKIKPCQLGAF